MSSKIHLLDLIGMYLSKIMREACVALCIGLVFTGCVSQSKYKELKHQKEKAEIKTEKLTEKLNNLNIYQKHLQDSLSKM